MKSALNAPDEDLTQRIDSAIEANGQPGDEAAEFCRMANNQLADGPYGCFGMPQPREGAVPDRPEIVCICGSMRFADEMRVANRDLTLAGVIVVAPGEAGESITGEQKTALDNLHRRKIDLADRVLIVNPGGYIGESTRREIAYARASGKSISFTDPA